MNAAMGLGLLLSAGLGLLLSSVRETKVPALIERISAPTPGRQTIRISFGLSRVEVWKSRIRVAFTSNRKMQATLFELPDILDLLAVALSAGDGLYAALSRVAPRGNGLVATQLQQALRALDLGSSVEAEMTTLAERLPHRQIAEFAGKVTLALRRGSPLAQLLREQAASARSEIQVQLLKKSGGNETKMMVPLVFLILPVTVLFAIYPSLQLLNLNYL
jgi:tight adherence protein C